MLQQPTLPHVGEQLNNRYIVREVIGRGGFATVYRATQLDLKRDVALKVLDLRDSASQGSMDSFKHEAAITAQLSHPNVITVHDYGVLECSGVPFISMELLEGHTLEQELEQHGPLDPARAMALFTPCFDALGAAHELGVIHKDLKPSNLFITHPGDPVREALVILDYGVARLQGRSRTLDGQLQGTPRYMAPEYIKGEPISTALDVYQIGLILCEALTGAPPVPDLEPFPAMMVHCDGRLEIPDALLASPLEPLITTCVALNPAERYPDGYALGEAARNLSADLTAIELQPRQRVEELVTSPTLAVPIPNEMRASDTQASRASPAVTSPPRRLLLALVPAVVLLVLLGSASLSYQAMPSPLVDASSVEAHPKEQAAPPRLSAGAAVANPSPTPPPRFTASKAMSEVGGALHTHPSPTAAPTNVRKSPHRSVHAAALRPTSYHATDIPELSDPVPAEARAVERRPEGSRLTYESMLSEAVQAIARGHHRLAIAKAEAALAHGVGAAPHRILARAHDHLGDRVEAIRHYNQALLLDCDSEVAARVRLRVEQLNGEPVQCDAR